MPNSRKIRGQDPVAADVQIYDQRQWGEGVFDSKTPSPAYSLTKQPFKVSSWAIFFKTLGRSKTLRGGLKSGRDRFWRSASLLRRRDTLGAGVKGRKFETDLHRLLVLQRKDSRSTTKKMFNKGDLGSGGNVSLTFLK